MSLGLVRNENLRALKRISEDFEKQQNSYNKYNFCESSGIVAMNEFLSKKQRNCYNNQNFV